MLKLMPAAEEKEYEGFYCFVFRFIWLQSFNLPKLETLYASI